MEITPPMAQINLQLFVRAGLLFISTFGLGGSQVPVGAGTHGFGVPGGGVATIVGALHVPKGVILTAGAKSIIVAAGLPSVKTVGEDVAFKGVGAAPKEH